MLVIEPMSIPSKICSSTLWL